MNFLRKSEIHKLRMQRWSCLAGLGFTLLALIGCTSMQQNDPTDIFQKTQSYKSHSFDEVWAAALRSTDEIDFIIRKEAKDIGFIYALAKENPDPSYLPPHMNVIIKEEDGRIDVHCHIELPGQRDDTGKRRKFASRFFRALKKNLK